MSGDMPAGVDVAGRDEDGAGAAAGSKTVHPLWAAALSDGAGPGATLGSWATLPYVRPDAAVDAPTSVCGFRGVAELAQGGMGRVSVAREIALDRDVALKTVRGEAVPAGAAAGWLVREARLLGGLEHPAIVPAFRLTSTTHSQPCMVMEEVRGRRWSDVLGGAGRTINDELAVLLRVCDAVAYMHSCGIVHRDLKPQNVMVDRFGQVVVLDLGVALTPEDGAGPRTGPGAAAGTPWYMAPEQARCDGRRLGPRTDVYLLGAILYEILTGRPPHQRDAGERSEPAILRAQEGGVVPPREAVRIDADPDSDLAGVCVKALAPEPEARFESVAAFAEALRSCVRSAARGRESEILAERAIAEMRSVAELPRASRLRAAGLSRAREMLDRATALSPGNATAAEALAETHRGLASDALVREEFYQATLSARRVAALDPEGDPAEVEEIRRRAFRGLLRGYPRLQSAVRFSFWTSLFQILAAAQGAWGMLPLLGGALPGWTAMFFGLGMAFVFALSVVPSARLLSACVGVRRGVRQAHQRATDYAAFILHAGLLMAPAGLNLWTAGSDFQAVLGGEDRPHVLPLLLGALLLAFAALRNWTAEDLERLPWREEGDAGGPPVDREGRAATPTGDGRCAPVGRGGWFARVLLGLVSLAATFSTVLLAAAPTIPLFRGWGPVVVDLLLLGTLLAIATALFDGRAWARFWAVPVHLTISLGLAVLGTCRSSNLLVAALVLHVLAGSAPLVAVGWRRLGPWQAHLAPRSAAASARMLLFGGAAATWLWAALLASAVYWDGTRECADVLQQEVSSSWRCGPSAMAGLDGDELRISCPEGTVREIQEVAEDARTWQQLWARREILKNWPAMPLVPAYGSPVTVPPRGIRGWWGIRVITITNGTETRVVCADGSEQCDVSGP